MDKAVTENEEKKLFLNSYLREKRAVIRLDEQLNELRLNKISPSVINDGMPHGNNTSDLSDYAARVDELEREMIQKRYARIRAFQLVRMAIESMEDEAEKELLTYRYLRGLKWEEIAVRMEYSWTHMHRIHSNAIKKLKMV